jgi:hypothetical protein
MATITWQNATGSLGNFPSGSSLFMQFVALSDDISSVVTYKLLSGNLPTGTKNDPVKVSLPGIISGTLEIVTEQKTYTFTIRAFDQFGNIRDRTFSLTLTVPQAPKFTLQSSKLFAVYDSSWTDYSVEYVNAITDNVVTFSCSSGSLPPGMYLTSDGKIRGYANPPTTISGTPTTKTYLFTLQLQSMLGNDNVEYSIEVINQRILKPPHSRAPAICNSRPLVLDTRNDVYYGSYVDKNVIPTLNANEYFTFKVIGHDFDEDILQYSFGKLPEGLVGDTATGWITGSVPMNNAGVNDYSFTVNAYKLNRPMIMSPVETFKLRVINDVVEDITWVTPENLGIINNNTVSDLSLVATSAKELVYTLSDGHLPANLFVENSGAISGKVAYQPSDTLLAKDNESVYTFTVMAYASDFPSLRSYKTFKLTVKQYFTEPVENVYFKAAPSLQGRVALKSLLTDTSLIPDNYLFRIDDPYFGKSTSVKIVQAYGIKASSLNTYIAAIQNNHYYRNVALGEIKTAIARNDSGGIEYEVVYAEISDDLVNPQGNSIPLEITLDQAISLNLGPWTINNSSIYTSYADEYFTSLTPGSVKVLKPASLDNMREVLVQNIEQNTDKKLLPRWMTDQQEDGNTIGFIRCWVICYTLPGKSSTIKSNIENNWNYQLNDIDCTFDRYLVDKSSTYNWNTNLLIPAWTEIPSEVPIDVEQDQHDLVVLFPRKTILPK